MGALPNWLKQWPSRYDTPASCFTCSSSRGPSDRLTQWNHIARKNLESVSLLFLAPMKIIGWKASLESYHLWVANGVQGTLLSTLYVLFYITFVTVLWNGVIYLHFAKDKTNAPNLTSLFRTQRCMRENVHCHKMAQISKNRGLIK